MVFSRDGARWYYIQVCVWERACEYHLVHMHVLGKKMNEFSSKDECKIRMMAIIIIIYEVDKVAGWIWRDNQKTWMLAGDMRIKK